MSCAVVVPYDARTPYAYPLALPPSLTPPPTPPPPLFPVLGPVELVAPTPRRVVSHGHSQSEPYQRPKVNRARRWSSLGDLHAHDLPTPRPVPAKASLALAELIDTEATYLAHLRSLVSNYFVHLPAMPPADLSALIRNAGALLDLHTRIAADLAAGPTSRTYVCGVLEGWGPCMATLYAEFCAGHDAAAAVLRRAQERDPQQWSSWECQCALHTHRRRHSLDEPPGTSGLALGFSDLLIMPVQRVCKYHLLVSAMRGTPGQDPEERAIMNAVNAMHNVAARVDDAQRIRQAEHRARLVLERMDPASGLDIAHLAKLGPCILIGSLDVCYYLSPTASKPTYMSHTASSLVTPSPSPHPLPSTVPFPQQTPTTPHPLSNSQKPLKVRHLAAFLWPGYLVLCKVNTKRSRYEPKHWFLLRQVAGPAPSVDDPDPDVSMEDMSFQQSQPPPMTHVDVSPASTVFTHGVRIAFAKHVFELGTSCAEERDVWLAAVAGAREVEREASVGTGAKVSRSRSAVTMTPEETEGLELVRSRSEGGRGRSRSRSRPPEKALGLGIAERVENVFLRDRQGESSGGVSPVSVNASLNGASVTRNASGGSPGRFPVRLSVVSGSGGTFKGTLSAAADGRTLGSADGRTLGPADGRALGPAYGHGHSLSVGTGVNVARTNSSSTSGTRSYPPSPVMTTHALQAQPAPTSQPQLQPQPQLTVQTQLLPVSLVVHRPGASVRDMVDRALADIVSWPCTEARMKGARRGPLFAAPEDPAGPKSAGAALGGGGVMGKVRPRRTSSALVGRHKSLLDALPSKEKEKKKARPASEGVVVEPKREDAEDKTPLQRKRASIHGAMQPFPTTDPPSPAREPHTVQVVAPSGQVIHPSASDGVQRDPAVSAQAQADVRRNGSTGSSQESGKRVSPPRSRTVSSSGSFADGVRELFSLRRTFVKSAENVAVAAVPNGPTPIYTVGAGLTNTRSDEALVAKTKPKASSAPALVPETGPGLYSLGAGITNTTALPRRKSKPSFSGRAPNLFAALTRRRTRTAGGTPLSALTFTPLSEKDLVDEADVIRTQTARSRSNEWYHPVPALRVAPDRAKLGADLCTPALRVQPSPVAEEGVFAEFGDEVYDEERY